MKDKTKTYKFTDYAFLLVILCLAVDVILNWVYGDGATTDPTFLVVNALAEILLQFVLLAYFVSETVVLWKSIHTPDDSSQGMAWLRFFFILALCVTLGYSSWNTEYPYLVDFWNLI